MPFARPSLQTILDRFRADLDTALAARGANQGVYLARSFEYALAKAIPGLAHGLYGNLDWISRQILPDTADDEGVLRWARLFLEVPRKQPTKATGTVTFTGSNGTIIPDGTAITVADGTEFVTDGAVTVSGGSASPAVIASNAGASGNVVTGAKVTLSSPIAGLSSSGTVDSPGLLGGTDLETIDAVLTRLLVRLRTPPRGGGAGDYVTWALETPTVSVDAAWEYPARDGLGSVGLAFTVGGDIPSGGDVTAVQTYVESKMPITVDRLVMLDLAAVPLTLEIGSLVVEDGFTTTEVRANIAASIASLIEREREPERVLPLSHIREAISTAAGEYDHVLVSPVADVDPGIEGLITFDPGTGITWS